MLAELPRARDASKDATFPASQYDDDRLSAAYCVLIISKNGAVTVRQHGEPEHTTHTSPDAVSHVFCDAVVFSAHQIFAYESIVIPSMERHAKEKD